MLCRPLSVEQLLTDYNRIARHTEETLPTVVQYNFPEFTDDVYNPYQFEYAGRQMLLARTEPRNDETTSRSVFLYRDSPDSPNWYWASGLPTFENLQDPFISVINDQVIMGGVKIEVAESPNGRRIITSWRTEFYTGNDIGNLELGFIGPKGMKDIRLVQLNNNQVGVFTRPQGEKGGLGKVGFRIFESFNDLTIESLEDAPLISNMFVDEEWGGVNQAFSLIDGNIGIIGHIARWDQFNNRHYFPFSCEFDPETMLVSEMQILGTKETHFPSIPAKRHDLDNVWFPGGIFEQEGKLHISGGLADTSSGSAEVKPTFADRLVINTVRISTTAASAGNILLAAA